MKLLTFTSLYPNVVKPSHGVFVENRLRHLVAGGRVEARVVAPVPWFPWRHARFRHYAEFARVPRREERFGIAVHHPRHAALPGIGMSVSPLAMALAARSTIADLIKSGFEFDAIDAHYFFPDGVAAMLLGKWFGRPVVITARGSDIAVLSHYAMPRRMIRWAAREASAVVTVARALKDALIALDVDRDKIVVLRNGVDLKHFTPMARDASRALLGLSTDEPVVVSVGRLVPLKGHDLVIEAIAALPGVRLLIAGSGPERQSLEQLVARLGVSERVHFLGQVAHDALPPVYSAADALVLASSSEGWANVLLEAMACGTPVVATDVGGSSEVVTAPEAGRMVGERSSRGIAAALSELLASRTDRAATRRYAECFGWDETTRGQERLFESLLPSAPTLQMRGAR